MKRSPIKSHGKVSVERDKGMRKSAPIVCDRAGGSWCGWTGEGCVGSMCENCGKYGWWYKLAHVTSRGQGGHEEPENLANLCLECHTLLDDGPPEVSDAIRAKLEKIGGRE